ncbi:MAG: hypothetical protein ACK50Z_04340 [Betaproteobacteria bacterium]|jgi:hypothetical protein
MKLYDLLSEPEKVAVKKATMRNSYVKDLTVEELGELADLITPKFAHNKDHRCGALVCLEELFLRQHHKEVTA